jgi:hypothetical protein
LGGRWSPVELVGLGGAWGRWWRSVEVGGARWGLVEVGGRRWGSVELGGAGGGRWRSVGPVEVG